MTASYAQPQKGDWQVGLDILPIAPKVGHFLTNRLVTGLEAIAGGTIRDDFKSLNGYIGVAPFVRYYFAPKQGMKAKKFYFFSDLNIALNHRFSRFNDEQNNQILKSSDNNINVGIAPGIVYHINEKVSVDAALRVIYDDIQASADRNLFTTYEAGLLVNLKKKNKTESNL